jgi:hypothetical protein
MIKHFNNNKFKKVNFGKWFNDVEIWNKAKKELLIRDKNELNNYQSGALSQIYDHYKIDKKIDVSHRIKNSVYLENTIKIHTSGTQSSISREYLYSYPQYIAIENHHWWRIEESHSLTESGLIYIITYQHKYDLENEYKDCYISEEHLSHAVGIHNKVKYLVYRRNTTPESLIKNLELMKKDDPKLLLCSASQLEWIYFNTNGEIKFNFPVVSTRETLMPHVRKMGEKMFSKVIDKMRCWDGGLTFYECPYGTLHICDELCYVEESDNGLITTDFFNYSTPFIRYLNGDNGVIGQKKCMCGIYGNFFERFYGKTSSLIFLGKYQIPGTLIVDDINNLILFGGSSSYIFSYSMLEKYKKNPFIGVDIIYCIRQRKDSSIDFIYQSNPPLSAVQKEALLDGLNFIFYRKLGSGLVVNNLEKRFSVENNVIRLIDDRNLLDENTGLRNKRQCVFSELY